MKRRLRAIMLGALLASGCRSSSPPPRTPIPVEPAALAACALGESLLARMPKLAVSALPAAPFDSAWSDTTGRQACRVAGAGHLARGFSDVDSLLDWFRHRGWSDRTTISADGPDGTFVGVHRREVTCAIEGRWDGGGDSDSTYVPSDTIEVRLTCTRAVPADTTLPGADERPAGTVTGAIPTITITRPTFIAGTSFTQAEADSDAETGEAVGDFTTYLQQIQDSLPPLGVAFLEANGGRIMVRAGRVSYLWSLRADSERISYLFAMPDRQPVVRYGVMVGEEIMQFVRRGLGLRSGENEWTRADAATVRLPPSAFPELPPPLRARLDALGCTVPQSYDDPKPHSVIHGHLRNPASSDWAVLCSVNRESRVLVFWSARPDSMESFGSARDVDYLQGTGGAIGFSRRIGIATARAILGYRRAFGDTSTARIDHDGVEDAFVGKASGIAYYDRGRWRTLQGAD